jgi:hypothetical protein
MNMDHSTYRSPAETNRLAREAAAIVCRALDLAKYEHDEDEALALFDQITRESGDFPDARDLADNLDLLFTTGSVQ